MNSRQLFSFIIFVSIASASMADSPSSILQPYLTSGKQSSGSSMKLETFKNGKTKVLSTDTNGDGKPDIFDYFSIDGSLKERREDQNFDGKIDKITLFPLHQGDKLIIKTDEKFNGRFDRIEERWQEGDYMVIHLKIDTKSKGVFDYETTSRVRKDKTLEESERGNCSIQIGTIEQLKNIQGLSKIFTNFAEIGPLSNDFYSTNFGYKIQKACVDSLGAEQIVNIVSGTLKTGLACEWQLGSSQSKGNVHKIASLMLNQKNPPKIICDEKGYSWGERILAHGSVPGDKNHPVISINPAIIKNRKTADLSSTFFHETLHNVGYLHEVDIDYPYACSSCCFNAPEVKTHDLACQICKGQYTGTNDRKYIEDITNFFSLDDRDERNMGILLNYLKSNPTDRWARFKLASANSSDITAPIGAAFAQTLKNKYAPLSSAEKSVIDKAEMSGNSEYTKLFMSPARTYSDSLLKFLDGNAIGAEAELKKFKMPPLPPGSTIGEWNYNYLSNTIQDLKKELAWKIYDRYEAAGNQTAKTRIFDEFLTDKRP